ncbi:hypothetical protein [Streptomyces lavendulae]|uniref:hypothetical protein n=1 Tax=Streptomyces lavendulae TaxID=1914 RepID=UPI0024A30605|nr:hypothetical protein [Streptomyces lavendulae]GLX22605.1 hypothetical protein Slala01_62490 [Streptomyces lavendulae subsp. lavendulae]GLX30088.1 hypothetical protein Slala02_59080 [Streptomyces lavendulae subsp. lavendulae]
MRYLVIDGARVVSAHPDLASARSAEAQGPGQSTEPGPLLDGEPAWWERTRRNGDAAELGILRTDATELGIRFELRACQAPAGSCRHAPCGTYTTWAVSRWYGLLSEFAAYVPLSWTWAGHRDGDPRGDTPRFLAEGQALVDRLAADMRAPLRAVQEPPADARTLDERAQAAHALVVRFLARHFGPAPSPETVTVCPLIHGQDLHLTLSPTVSGDLPICGTALSECGAESTSIESDARPCDQCFGRIPIVPPPVLTAAEHAAWTAYIDRSGS